MLNLLPDVGAPAVVATTNVVLRGSSTTILGQPLSDAAVYFMTAAGYLAGYMRWGGQNNDFLKNIGVASAALSMEKAYDALRAGTATQARVMTGIRRYPGPAAEGPFQGTKLSGIPRLV